MEDAMQDAIEDAMEDGAVCEAAFAILPRAMLAAVLEQIDVTD